MENTKTQNKGKAWTNIKKEKATHPDFKGKGNFNGVDFEFAMWYNEAKTPEDYPTFSVSFSEPYKKEGSQPFNKEENLRQSKSFSPQTYGAKEADKIFRRDIEQEYENEDDRDIF